MHGRGNLERKPHTGTFFVEMVREIWLRWVALVINHRLRCAAANQYSIIKYNFGQNKSKHVDVNYNRNTIILIQLPFC
jgi:hypothetical protein